jgi:hypothetical protein
LIYRQACGCHGLLLIHTDFLHCGILPVLLFSQVRECLWPADASHTFCRRNHSGRKIFRRLTDAIRSKSLSL